MNRKSLLPVACLFMLMCLVLLVYQPGLHGGFLFDDYPNLEELGSYGGVVDWETLKAFVLNGQSGPIGRPLSLLSFLLNDNYWPSNAEYFKQTNLLIHIACGLALYWASFLVLRFYAVNQQKAIWVALISTALWVLHPYFVSTTLYVVQRMAQLATFFSLLGIVGYLKGRSLLRHRVISGYLVMSASIGIGCALATLSKENGALLPVLILVVEFCHPGEAPRPAWQWSLVCLWLPSLAVLLALASFIDFSNTAWPTRPFNQSERLLSEGRIMWEYLSSLFIPRIEGRGLFQDGYLKSTGLLTPVTTLFAHLGLLALLVVGVVGRKKLPLLSLAILFFLAAHLMESTFIGLELYFEHRNYLSAVFLFMPLAAALVWLSEKISPVLVVCASCGIVLLLAAMTWQRSTLWGDSEKLELYWAQASPNSPRAQNTIAAYLIERGRAKDADRVIEEAVQRLPESSLLAVRMLLQRVYARSATQYDFEMAAEQLAKQPFDAQAVKGLRLLNDCVVAGSDRPEYRDYMLNLLRGMQANRDYERVPLFVRIVPYLSAQIYLAMRQPDQAVEYYLKAMALYADADSSLAMVSEMAVAGYPLQALTLLNQAEVLYKAQPVKTLRRSAAIYDSELSRLQQVLRESILEKNQGNAFFLFPVSRSVA